MTYKLPHTLQAVPNSLHARLEIADAIRKLFPTELRKAGFNPDEPRVPAGNPQGGQWTIDSGSGSWFDALLDWFRHTSDPEWAEAQRVQDLVENHPRAAVISGSIGLGIALGPAIIALADGALSAEGISVAARAAELQRAIPAAQKGRITMAVGLAEDASGNRFVLIGSSERMAGLRKGITLNSGEFLVRGFGHAEADIVNFARQNGLNLLEIGATRPICSSCASLIKEIGATPVTRLRVR
jgi:hypothetical protein